MNQIEKVYLRLFNNNNTFGQVLNHKTLDPKSFKPYADGLYGQSTFGPVNNYECACGKYSGINYKGTICEICGVSILNNYVTRIRGGYIKLFHPVVNMFLFENGFSSNISKLFGLPIDSLRGIIYYNSYIVIENGISKEVKKNQILNYISKEIILLFLEEILSNETLSSFKKEAQESINFISKIDSKDNYEVFFSEDYVKLIKDALGVEMITGSSAFKRIISPLSLDNIQNMINKSNSKKKEIISDREGELKKKRKSLIHSINAEINFLKSIRDNNIDIFSLITDKIFVTPCGLRPAMKFNNSVAIDGTSYLYMKVMLANNSLKKCLSKEDSLFFEEVLKNSLKRSVQKAVDFLMSGDPNNEDVKGFTQILSGKYGFIRGALGKRLDYSARSVIISGPNLKLGEVGLPVKMALKLLQPQIINVLIAKGLTSLFKEAENMVKDCFNNLFTRDENVKKNRKFIISILKELCKEFYVLVIRNPALHRHSAQVLKVVLNQTNATQIHPCITKALNADFDGDTVAMFAILTKWAIEEAKKMISSKNITDLKSGDLIIGPTQDIILGIYNLSEETNTKKFKIYYSLKDIYRDYELKKISISDILVVPGKLLKENFSNEDIIFTNLGKIIFNSILPLDFPYIISFSEFNKNPIRTGIQKTNLFKTSNIADIKDKFNNYVLNEPWRKKDITIFFDELAKIIDMETLVNIIDEAKRLGFEYATKIGNTISIFQFDLINFQKIKDEEVKKCYNKIEKISNYLSQGFISSSEEKDNKIKAWADCKNILTEKFISSLVSDYRNTSIFKILDSGARISEENIAQTFVMRGNMVNYKGQIEEDTVISSLYTGVTPFEIVASSTGAIKGVMDTTYGTAKAGDSNRTITYACESIIVTSKDCNTSEGRWVENNNPEKFERKIYGRVSFEDILNESGEILIKKNTLILIKHVKILKENNIKGINIRSIINCLLYPRICSLCYGIDRTKTKYISQIVPLGSNVGVLDATSVGEVATQMIMRTFYLGGAFQEEGDISQGLPKIKEITELTPIPKEKKAVISFEDGEIIAIRHLNDNLIMIEQKISDNTNKIYYSEKRKICVSVGDKIKKGDLISKGAIDLNEYILILGRTKCSDYIEELLDKVYGEGLLSFRHLEIIVSAMISKVEVSKDSGDYLEGSIIEYNEAKRNNISFKERIFSLKKIISFSSSFLSRISFQNTPSQLINCLLNKPLDNLNGSRGNLMIGNNYSFKINKMIKEDSDINNEDDN